MVTTEALRYNNHRDQDGALCSMSGQHQPITGHAPTDYVSRAYLIADLAEQVQDRDTTVAWEYLTALPANELQRMLMLALAAIPIEGRSVDDIWQWVAELPVAVTA